MSHLSLPHSEPAPKLQQFEIPTAAMMEDAISQIHGEGLSEDALARLFVAIHGSGMRFCHHLGKWLIWNGNVWKIDQRRLAFDFVRRVCREHGKTPKFAKASVAEAVERFARADPIIARCSSDWDQDPMLLGTPGGTVDLRTGNLRSADPEYMITKSTAVAPRVGNPERWLSFLNDATGGDQELIAFLQRVCGYCLTGDTQEHALFFIHGPGGNGKSVFLNTLVRVMGEYAVTAAMETFIASRGDRHSTDIAALRGARLVTASETEEGRSWAEARIKQMTGGDRITARFMRQDNFSFDPQFKLLIVGNHEPVLRNVDEAMRRRFNVIGFRRKPSMPDPRLAKRLEEEYPQILDWMIRGTGDWLATGLDRPSAVTEATDEYFEGQDLVGRWLAECCDEDRSYLEPVGQLFVSWEHYAQAVGEWAGSEKKLGSALKRRGFTADRVYLSGGTTRVYRGLRLKPSGATRRSSDLGNPSGGWSADDEELRRP
jgi:putative DNA primase/helicase